MSYRLQNEVVRNGVEERPDVQIEHPVQAPTALPADPDRVKGRATRPIPIGVRVEVRLHPGLKV
jgi:hypothetical protein